MAKGLGVMTRPIHHPGHVLFMARAAGRRTRSTEKCYTRSQDAGRTPPAIYRCLARWAVPSLLTFGSPRSGFLYGDRPTTSSAWPSFRAAAHADWCAKPYTASGLHTSPRAAEYRCRTTPRFSRYYTPSRPYLLFVFFCLIFKLFTVPLQCLWHGSVTLISILLLACLLTYLLTYSCIWQNNHWTFSNCRSMPECLQSLT